LIARLRVGHLIDDGVADVDDAILRLLEASGACLLRCRPAGGWEGFAGDNEIDRLRAEGDNPRARR
jgi:hypothetical protein